MSVLYKALQKAEKENELRQSESGFDTQRLAASGALKAGGLSRGRQINRATMGAIAILAVGAGVGFLMFQDSLLPAPAAPALPVIVQAPVQAPVETAVAAAPAAAPSAETPPAAAVPAPMDGAEPAAPAAPAAVETAQIDAPAAEMAASEEVIADAPAEEAPPTQVASARAPSRPATRQSAQRAEPMPHIPADSRARMLSPPIAITRNEFALAGVGDQVQVREVSQNARSNVAAGYDALVRGSYDTALGFYDSALKEEPNSVLALLGRGTALQKMGKGPEAQAPYDQVLKLDPQNREALTNLTTILAERSPQEALSRLIELEREYPGFSPIKGQIGLTYAKMGSMPQALDYLRRAVTLSPDTVMYHYNLALVLDHLGRPDQALASYERVLASISGGRGPTDISATEIERRVRFLRAR
jgi:tetratricopeptide (TPR) repeat protein